MVDEQEGVKVTADAEPFVGLEPVGDVKMSPAHGLAAVALNMALKYHDISVIKDGNMYQTMKLEGRNIKSIGIRDILDTAELFEAHLMSAPNRLSQIVIDALVEAADEELGQAAPDDTAEGQSS